MLVNLLSFASIMKSIGGVLLAVVILLAMVTIHEFGHYVAGKLLGFKITEFAVGFGPAILKKRSKKTGEIFALRIVPLGGYCAFDGEDYDEEDERHQGQNKNEKDEKNDKTDEEEPFAELKSPETEAKTSVDEATAPVEDSGGVEKANKDAEYPEPKGERFNDQPPWKRIIVLIAGATMNYLLAVFLIILMFATTGRMTHQVIKNAPEAGFEGLPNVSETYETGLLTGDVILKVEGKTMYLITDYMSVLDGKKQGETVEILVLREGREKTVEVTLIEDAAFANMSDTGTLLYSLGIATRGEVDGVMQTTRGGGLTAYQVKDGFFETIGNSFVYSIKIGGTVLRSLGELLTGKLGIDSMGGPVTTIKVTSEVAASGFASFLNIAAFIGVNLAVFNLLPIPALDGCKVIFCLIEWIRKKPVNRKVETMIHFIGIIFLFGFAILVDLLQLF